MSCTFFSKPYLFVEYHYAKYHYTDNRKGSPAHYLAYMVEGSCRIVSQHGTLEVGPGDAFYIPMGLPYQSYWYGNDTIRFHSYGFTGFPEAKSCRFCLQKLPSEPALLEAITAIPLTRHPDSAALGALYCALAQLVPLMETDALSTGEQLLDEAKKYMTDRPDCRVTDIAQHCCVSESALYAAFRKHTGKTPNEVRQELLSDRAVRMLTTTDRSVQDISDSLGFSSVSYFRKILKKHTDKTPSQIRKHAGSL